MLVPEDAFASALSLGFADGKFAAALTSWAEVVTRSLRFSLPFTICSIADEDARSGRVEKEARTDERLAAWERNLFRVNMWWDAIFRESMRTTALEGVQV